MSEGPDAFVIRRLRAKPVEYSVKIRHFVAAGEWQIGVSVFDVSDPDEIQRARVAADLRRVADLLESGGWQAS